jgi:hypothetical protein
MNLDACIHKSTFFGHLLINIQSMTPKFEDSPLIELPPTSNTIIQHCIIILPSYTWGCHHPLTNAKVRRKGAVGYTKFGHAPSQKEPH